MVDWHTEKHNMLKMLEHGGDYLWCVATLSSPT